jgi:hypothetical protein
LALAPKFCYLIRNYSQTFPGRLTFNSQLLLLIPKYF